MFAYLRNIYSALKTRRVTVAGGVLAIIAWIPNWHGIILWWWAVAKWVAPRIGPTYARAFLVVLGLILALLDNRRLLARHGKPHPDSIKAHALALRDDMKKFLDNLGTREAGLRNGESEIEFIARSGTETARRWHLLGHYYELHCAQQTRRIFHEMGIRGIHDGRLYKEASDRMKEEEYQEIIQALSEAAERVESNARI